MAGTKRQRERLIALWFLGLIALNYPFLSLFSEEKLLFKIPVLFLYIFLVWAFFICSVAYLIEKPPPTSSAADNPTDSLKTD